MEAKEACHSDNVTTAFWPPSLPLLYVPVDGVLVELAELPVDGEDVHVVVLLEVVSQQVQGVLASLQPLLVLKDLLHLKDRTHTHTHSPHDRRNKLLSCIRLCTLYAN